MAIKCGFFNSVNHDRIYSAEDMTQPYSNIISDGVFMTQEGTPSTYLVVVADEQMRVKVKAGRGIFAGKWFLSDSDVQLSVDSAEPVLDRIDSVVVKIDSSENVRAASIILKKGVPAAVPSAPSLVRNDNVKEYRLGNILVTAGSTYIRQTAITDMRPSADCGWVTHLLTKYDTTGLYLQWQAAFDEWFGNVKETLSTATLIRSYESHYKTTVQNEKVIPIQIIQYNRNIDILHVYINGLMLIRDVDYTLDSNTQITLTAPVDRNTVIAFTVYKSIDGSDAETVVQQVYDLQNLTNVIRITDEIGSTKIRVNSGEDFLAKFVEGGRGFHTAYSQTGALNTPASGAFRYFGHITSAGEVGWVYAMQSDGSIYTNYLNGGQWRGWRAIYEKTPAPLWLGQSFMNENQTVIPSKKLSDCRNGWVLLWSDYDDATKTKNNYNAVSFCVPKRNASGNIWNGSSFMCCLPRAVNEDGTFVIVAKQVYIHDDRIVGFISNNKGAANRDVILSAVYEY